MVSNNERPNSSDEYNVCNYIADGNMEIVTVDCNYRDNPAPRRGRYVVIQRHIDANEKHLLNFCEVEVKGCFLGFYGYNKSDVDDCSLECSEQCNSTDTCRVQDGHCYTCKAGLWGEKCDKPCNCGWNGRCDQRRNGDCGPKGCAPGYVQGANNACFPGEYITPFKIKMLLRCCCLCVSCWGFVICSLCVNFFFFFCPPYHLSVSSTRFRRRK